MDQINSLANDWAVWMVGISWQLCVLVLALLILDPLLRGRSATIRYGIWSLVLLRLILPPTFALPTGWGWWTAEYTQAIATAPQTSLIDENELLNASSSPAASNSSDSAPSLAPRVFVRSDSSFDSSGQASAEPSKMATTNTSSRSWLGYVRSLVTASRNWFFQSAPVLLLVYLGMVCAQFGMLLSSSLQVRQWASKARLIVDPQIEALFDQCRERVGLSLPIELRDSESCTTPLVVGVLRPVILIPSPILNKLTHDELAAVLTHELQHIRRRDGLVNLAQAILGVAYFFHPVLWLANARIRSLREDVCDELTLSVLETGPRPYGSALLKVAETLGYAAPPLAMGVLDGKTPLKQRMLRILDPKTAAHNPWGIQSLIVTTMVALILLPGGGPPAAAAHWKLTTLFRFEPIDDSTDKLSHPHQPANPSTTAPVVVSPQAKPAPRARFYEPTQYFRGQEEQLQYHVEVAIDNGDRSQRFEGALVYEVLAMNDDSMVTMFRPSLQGRVVRSGNAAFAPGVDLFPERNLNQGHPQSWSRTGVATPGDGPPLMFLNRSFASLVLPWLPDPQAAEVKENRSWSIRRPAWMATSATLPPTGPELWVPASDAIPEFGPPRMAQSGPSVDPFGPLRIGPRIPRTGPPLPFYSPWDTSEPMLYIEERRVSRKLGPDENNQLVVQESIHQVSQDDSAPVITLEGTITARIDSQRRLPLETVVEVLMQRSEKGETLRLPVRITFTHIETSFRESP